MSAAPTRLRRVSCAVALATLACLHPACRDAGDSPPRLYAAASLVNAVESLPSAGAPAFDSASGATSLLVRQIRSGAAPGVLIAADPDWADTLETEGLVEAGTRVDLLANGLVVIVAAHVDVLPTSLRELAEPTFGRIALAETEHVPAGRYARAALESVGAWESVRSRLLEATDARAAVALVARGEADLGIAYASDATTDGVRVAVEIPADLHPRIVYPLVLLRDAPPAARDLWAWLQGREAADAFEAAGFRPLLR